MPERAPTTPNADAPRFLAACARKNHGRPPVWLMRQAGRYLPEYQAMRARYSFVEMCTQPDLAVEISLQPYRRFGFDAVIVFYDILFLPEAMGAPLEFTGNGPVFRHPIRSRADIDRLAAPDLDDPRPGHDTQAIFASLRRLRAELPAHTALLGFAGAPFTLASYLVEGAFQRSGDRIRRLMQEDPQAVHGLLERLARSTSDYLLRQIEAGADAVQLFDTWAGLLGIREYDEFAHRYHREIFAAIARTGAPSILFVNGSAHVQDRMAKSGASALSIDWRSELADCRRRLGDDIVLQGNLDPTALFASPQIVAARTREVLDSMAGDPAFVFNLGHGILPETPVRSVAAMVDAVRRHGADDSV